MAERPRAKKMEGRRIATVTLANVLEWKGDPRTLLIRFTDGGTATIDADCTDEGEPTLEIEVDGHY